ncbi:MAG: hypothetical protein JST10_10210 [Bacteroidetes bacterium]|nr:hypothetical protein [Bacteroidota bacterium]MBS1632932.1 hypothetical protein [Bacteroidota bacterium]
MKLIVHPKSKAQEKLIKNFLDDLNIGFSVVEEEQVSYSKRRTKSKRNKTREILDDLDKSVDFVNKVKKGKVKAKSLKQLLNEL